MERNRQDNNWSILLIPMSNIKTQNWKDRNYFLILDDLKKHHKKVYHRAY